MYYIGNVFIKQDEGKVFMRVGKHINRIVLLICLSLVLCTGCIKLVEIPYIEVKVEDSVFRDKFYFSQLSEDERLAYKEVYQGILDHQEEIYVHCEDPDAVNSLLQLVLFDFGEIFWIEGSAASTSYEIPDGNDKYTVLKPPYCYSSEEREQKDAELEVEVTKIISNIPADYTDYEVIKYLYEYLVNTVTYVEDAPDNQNLYSAIVGKESVCAGYAKANQYLLNRMGIPCIYVTGKATQNGETEGHAWNIVRCNEKYYCVDVTWADAIGLEGEPGLETDMLYDYLCCSEATLADTHTPDPGYDYPSCTSEDLDYYRMNQMFYESIDRKQLSDAMYNSIDAKEKSTTFKFADAALYEEGKALVLEKLIEPAAQHLAERYGLEEVTCTYAEQGVLNKLIIYWNYE